MPSGNFHYYLVTKLNADVTSRTRKLHCYVVKFRFTSLFLCSVLSRARSSLACASEGIFKRTFAHAPLYFLDLVIYLESIEHDYVRI